jgi:hypothetical protein
MVLIISCATPSGGVTADRVTATTVAMLDSVGSSLNSRISISSCLESKKVSGEQRGSACQAYNRSGTAQSNTLEACNSFSP